MQTRKFPDFDRAAARAVGEAARVLSKNPVALLQSFIDTGKLDPTPEERAAILAKLEETPCRRRALYLRGRRGVPKAAIRAFCYECLGWGDHPELCTSPGCVLYGLRPRQKG